MKKYLLIALAALGFAACAENQEDINPSLGGEVEESYVAINLMSADLETRAATDEYGYEDGTDVERAIKTAYFFFFDQNGAAFNVTGGAPATAPGGGVNHLSLTIGDTTGKVAPNISDIKNAVLVLKTYKGVYPSQIVAVLNWTPTADKAYSLAELHAELATIGNDEKGYVMSNSVYKDGAGKAVDAAPLTIANIKTTEADALAAPVEIYVERIAAKVTLTASGKVADGNIFKTEKKPSLLVPAGTASEVEVYVKLHGWELYNDYATSYLLKNIDPTWSDDTLGFTWNDSPYFRCYWADSQNTAHNDSFSWEYSSEIQTAKGYPTANGFSVSADAKYATGTYTYCGENTNSAARTKVILKGQLMQSDGNGGYTALELARWYGTEYAGNEALRIAVANSLKYTLFYKDAENNKYVGIHYDDLQPVAGTSVGAKAYEVGFQLSTEGQKKEWYKYDSTNGYQLLGDAAVSNVAATHEYLKGVEPAILYADGNTYYTVDIKHLGKAEKAAEYGVVRNHVYQIDIQKILGYGSPVYNGYANIETPESPEVEDESSYVAARINVLSWKVVKQGVQIGQ